MAEPPCEVLGKPGGSRGGEGGVAGRCWVNLGGSRGGEGGVAGR